MGYTTYFDGSFEISPPLNPDQVAYLHALAGTRRMKRDAAIAEKFEDPKRKAVGLPIGEQAEFFVGSELIDDGNAWNCNGQSHDESIIDYNDPPDSQPGLWLQWTPSDDGETLEWDEGEKFYYYVEWLEYLIEKFFTPWGCKLNGKVEWSGEDSTDMGTIHVKDNVVKAIPVKILREEPNWDE